MNNTNWDMRKRIYRLLIEGHAQCKVAKILKLHKNKVQYYTSKLIEERAIRFISSSTPTLYVKGVNHKKYDQIWSTTDGGGVEDSPFIEDELCCINNLQFKSKIIKIPKENSFKWEKIKKVNKTIMKFGKMSIPVGFLNKEMNVGVQQCGDKTMVFRLEKIIVNSTTIDQKNEWIDGIAHYLVKIFAKFGFSLGFPQAIGKRHFAFREQIMDKLPVGGRIDDHSWIDKTGIEKGKAHWETDSVEYANQKKNLVPDMINAKEEIKEIKNELKEVKNTQSEILKELKKVPEEVRSVIREEQSYKPSKIKDEVGYR